MLNQTEYTIEILIYSIVMITIAGMLMELLIRVRRRRKLRERTAKLKAKSNHSRGLWE